MIILTAEKQTWERKDYDADASQWLVSGDSITAVDVSTECITTPGDAALVVDAPATFTSQEVKVWVSAGTNGKKYKITLKITTQAGRKVECEIIMKVKDI